MTTETNSSRFVNAYNLLDHCLRTQYNFKTNISFSDLIRRCASLNQVIRSYEDDLLDLARLRNAIIHHRNEQIIAEPHDDIVELMEKIARIISTPPLAVDVIRSVAVITMQSDATLKQVLAESHRVGHGNIPVLKNNNIIGVWQRESFVSVFAGVLAGGRHSDEFLANTAAEHYFRDYPQSNHFSIASAQIGIEQVLALFNKNRKMSSVIITSDGTASGKLMGIVTTADIIDLLQVLEKY